MKVGAGETAMKTCTKCGAVKVLDDFFKAKMKPLGVSSHCKACKKQAYLADYAKDPEKYAKRVMAWKSRNPDAVRRIRRAGEKLPSRVRYLALETTKSRRKEIMRAFHDRNPAAAGLYNKAYRKRHVDGRFAAYKARYRAALGIGYINELLAQGKAFAPSFVPRALAEAKQQHLKVHRLINQKEKSA